MRKATTPDQLARALGNQTGGSVLLFVETDDFSATHARLRARRDVRRGGRDDEPTAPSRVCLDLYGNKIDLIEPRGR